MSRAHSTAAAEAVKAAERAVGHLWLTHAWLRDAAAVDGARHDPMSAVADYGYLLEMLACDIGKRVRDELAGWCRAAVADGRSMRAVADAAGVSHTTVQNWCS